MMDLDTLAARNRLAALVAARKAGQPFVMTEEDIEAYKAAPYDFFALLPVLKPANDNLKGWRTIPAEGPATIPMWESDESGTAAEKEARDDPTTTAAYIVAAMTRAEMREAAQAFAAAMGADPAKVANDADAGHLMTAEEFGAVLKPGHAYAIVQRGEIGGAVGEFVRDRAALN